MTRKILIVVVFLFASHVFANEPPPPPYYEELWTVVKTDDVKAFKKFLSVHREDIRLSDVPAGAVQEGAIKILRYMAPELSKEELEPAFKTAIYENKMAIVKYFVEELKLKRPVIYSPLRFDNLAHTNNVEIMAYLIAHYPDIPSDEISSTYSAAVDFGEAKMVNLLRKQKAKFLDPAKSIQLMAGMINNSSGLGTDNLLAFALATTPTVTLASKRIELTPTQPNNFGTFQHNPVDWEYGKDPCPVPVLASSQFMTQVFSHQIDRAGCEARISGKEKTWTATVYGVPFIYPELTLVTAKNAAERAQISLNFVPKSGWWAEWLENNVHYFAAFSCRAEGEDTCLTTPEAKDVIQGLQFVKQPGSQQKGE